MYCSELSNGSARGGGGAAAGSLTLLHVVLIICSLFLLVIVAALVVCCVTRWRGGGDKRHHHNNHHHHNGNRQNFYGSSDVGYDYEDDDEYRLDRGADERQSGALLCATINCKQKRRRGNKNGNKRAAADNGRLRAGNNYPMVTAPGGVGGQDSPLLADGGELYAERLPPDQVLVRKRSGSKYSVSNSFSGQDRCFKGEQVLLNYIYIVFLFLFRWFQPS